MQKEFKEYIPASLQVSERPEPIPSTHTVHQRVNQNKRKENQPRYTLAPTFDIPLGSSKTSAKRTSPAVRTKGGNKSPL